MRLKDLLLGPLFHWSSVLIRREWIDQIGSFDERLKVAEEWELTLRLALAGCPMARIPQPLTIARKQRDGLTTSITEVEGRLVLDKVFSDPQLPKELLTYEDFARASELIRVAGSAYLKNDSTNGWNFLERALHYSADFPETCAEPLLARLVAFVTGLTSEEPGQVINRIAASIPSGVSQFQKVRRTLWSQYYLQGAFLAFQMRDTAKCITYAFRAVAKSPKVARNKGLYSIIAQSLMGHPTPSRSSDYRKSLVDSLA